MANIAVVYHPGYGHTQPQAQAVADGADGRLLAIDADGNLPAGAWDELAAADMIVFGAPTYMGGPSWQFKRFADASSRPWFNQAWKDKLFAGFTNSAAINGDKHSTMHYFITLALQHGGLWVSQGIMPSSLKSSQRDDLNRLGSYAGAIAQSATDASPSEMSPGDLETARQFGARLAGVAGRWARK